MRVKPLGLAVGLGLGLGLGVPSSLKRSIVVLPDGSCLWQSSRPTFTSLGRALAAFSTTACAPNPSSTIAAEISAFVPHCTSHGSPEKKTALSCAASAALSSSTCLC